MGKTYDDTKALIVLSATRRMGNASTYILEIFLCILVTNLFSECVVWGFCSVTPVILQSISYLLEA